MPSFDSLRVLVLESRRATEMATLVANYGGRPVSAPALREVPLDTNTEAFAFIDRLLHHEFDLVVLLTGVGTRALLAVVDRRGVREEFVAALGRTKLAARGPKPVAVLRELGLAPWVTAPEPNTWRELLAALDTKAGELTMRGARVAVQEYGAANLDLLGGLRERGADVISVPVYRWAMPDDLQPLQDAVGAIVKGEIDVAIFTTATQVAHLLEVARQLNQEAAMRQALRSTVVASVGPTTSEELREQGLSVDIEASHPKMGFLVREAAERAADLLRVKREGPAIR